ncbi:hypothetical protein [Sphingosinicella sp. CPCC 101087]|uniref:hypothetical protein n=1 Tax=Sphingosinicella sp. CPCC 101087 TaxID=2497754 RepID=UPI00101D6F69|nr:hypothetical protein [Sphingosinicella sp. CPCC 101087]
MALEFIVTDAGRAALVNAQGNGTAPVVIAEYGISSTAFANTPATVALPDEIKRLVTLSGDVVDDDTIHLVLRDETSDVFTLRSIALYLEDGTLFGTYSQADPILEKSAASVMLVALDAKFADIDAALLEFGDTNFLNPPATKAVQGVVELATEDEATAGVDDVRAVTPKGLLGAVTAWLDSRFGADAPSAFVKGLLTLVNALTFRTGIGLGTGDKPTFNGVTLTGNFEPLGGWVRQVMSGSDLILTPNTNMMVCTISGATRTFTISSDATNVWPARSLFILSAAGGGDLIISRAPGVQLLLGTVNRDVTIASKGFAILAQRSPNVWDIVGSGLS